MVLASWFHSLDPTVFSLGGGFAVRWYGLSYLAGFIIAWLVMMALAKRGKIAIPPHRVSDALMWLILGTLIGGRLGYALVYDRSLLTGFSNDFPFWRLLAINHGGMASHGGIIGCIVAAWRISLGWRPTDMPNSPQREGKSSFAHIIDVVALISPFGLGLGRIANFINGELLGKVVTPPGQPGPAWAVQFPQELSGWLDRGLRDTNSHTPQLSGEQLVKLNELVQLNLRPGEAWSTGVSRLIASASKYQDQLSPLLSSRHPSQLYQAAADGLVLAVCVWLVWLKTKTPGVVAAWWVMVYGVLRVATELYRLPDAQFGPDGGRPMGLSRGQWLSVGMFAVGAAYLAYVLWRKRRAATSHSAEQPTQPFG